MRNQVRYNEKFLRIDYMGLDRDRPREIAIYARVSTEQEEQINALENQIKWFDDQLKIHPNWSVENTHYYIDKGISGTQAKKRPAFLKMIEDAKKGEFDLIVTREVCRFARNVVDTLVVTRDLKNYGVEVYFIQDSIWTMDGDGELRLSLMATLAQEESRKISERVKAGFQVCKEKGVLFGAGNILGYDRVNDTYVRNEEQAETVTMIYDLYLEGNGCLKIAHILTERHRKNASGIVKWTSVTVDRILKNKTYTGKCPYNKSRSNNYLEQKRINNLDPSTYDYREGNFKAIISDETFEKAKLIREKKTAVLEENGVIVKRGRRISHDFWCERLRCSCGSRFRRETWSRSTNKNKKSYGYICYNHANHGSKEKRLSLGLDGEGYCDLKTIPEWKLNAMANKIFCDLIYPKREKSIEIALDLIQKNFKKSCENTQDQQNNLLDKIEKENSKKQNLINLRLEGELSKEEFDKAKAKIDKNIELLKVKIEELKTIDSSLDGVMGENIEVLRKKLEKLLEYKEEDINRDLMGKIIVGVIAINDNEFDFYLNLNGKYDTEVLFEILGRKNKYTLNLEDIRQNSSLHIASKTAEVFGIIDDHSP